MLNWRLTFSCHIMYEETKNVQGVALALERELYVVQRGYTPRWVKHYLEGALWKWKLFHCYSFFKSKISSSWAVELDSWQLEDDAAVHAFLPPTSSGLNTGFKLLVILLHCNSYLSFQVEIYPALCPLTFGMHILQRKSECSLISIVALNVLWISTLVLKCSLKWILWWPIVNCHQIKTENVSPRETIKVLWHHTCCYHHL